MAFKPGQSGNPGGRPGYLAALRQYIAGENGERTKADVDAIRAIAEDKTEKGDVRLRARTWLVEQVLGKASIAITGLDGGPIQTLDVSKLSPEQLIAYKGILKTLKGEE